MLRITSITPGAVEYLLRGSDCAAHTHTGQARESGAGTAINGVGYLLAGAEREPAGVWFGAGLPMLGIEPGTVASKEAVRAVFGRLEHPTRVDERGNAEGLGSRPRSFRSREQRLADAWAAEPDATQERHAQIRNQVHAQKRKAVAYYDLTFSAVKSVSVYWAGLVAEGRHTEAASVIEAHRAGVAAAMAYVEREAAQVRSGYHGKAASGRSVGVYEPADGLVWTRWDHSTSRAREPHLHSHVAVLARGTTSSDGVIRALDGRAFAPIKQGAAAIYHQVSREAIAAANGVVFATREDGKEQEILGFTPQLLRQGSTRNTQVAARRAVLVEEFAAAQGRMPSPREHKGLDRAAWRETRAAKTHTVSPHRQITDWAAPRRGELERAVQTAGALAQRVAELGHPDHDGYARRSREQVLRAAVDTVQQRYATWTVGNLVDAIAQEQHRTPAIVGAPDELAADVLAHADRYGVANLAPRDVGTVPAVLQGPTGRSRYRPRNDGRYATTGHLRTETAIGARARATGATALTGPALGRVRAELDRFGLSPMQRDAVLAIVSSGRRGDVLIGPAGAGKSRTVGALARVWETHVGGRVIGVATSTIAANVLAAEGLTALNSTRFRNLFTPGAAGAARERLGPRDLVVVDEAGMSNTAELDGISALVSAAGAKLLYTGDHRQLPAIGAGGMLELLVHDGDPIVLGEIHRFTHPWERLASAQLRDGNPDALAAYDRHGRIRGGTQAEMTDAAVRGYLADVLDGRHSILIVGSNALAGELSGRIRDVLVDAGRVGGQVWGVAADGNPVGVGDLIQARRNDPTIPVQGAGMVTNREIYEVLDRNPLTGALIVQGDGGVRAQLPAGYVREYTTLAYAVTRHAAQGLSTGTGHNLTDPGTDRAGVYVPGTRGRDANTFYVICRQEPGLHDPAPLDRTPIGVLTDILTRPADTTTAAELARRAGEEEGRSLAWIGTQWDLLTAEYARDWATDTLLERLGAEVVQRVVDEPGYPRLLSAVRSMELAGHDPAAVLIEAVQRGGLHDADSVSDVLRYRVRLLEDSGRRPERTVSDGDWASFTTPFPGPVGEYARLLAEAATDRQVELGRRAAADPPGWALTAPTLGPPPGGGLPLVEWVRRAGIVAAYRDLHAVPDTHDSIGPAPSREREFHHALWRQAAAALGHPADALDYTTATTGELREMREVWQRAQTWAPAYVADELHQARLDVEDHRRDYLIWRAGVDRHPPGSLRRELAERDITGARTLHAYAEARIDLLERVQEVRDEWLERTRPLQERAHYAGEELERRGLDRDTTAPVGEQQELFTLTDIDTDITAERTETAGGKATRAGHEAGHEAEPTRVSAASDCHSALLADAEQTIERDHHQPGLFPADPAARDVAAAHPLHTRPASAGGAGDSSQSATDSSTDERDVTVDQAARQAAVVAALRAEINARAAAAAPERLRTSRTNRDDVGYGYSDDQDSSYGEQTAQDSGLGSST